jgi:hypothetical protein
MEMWSGWALLWPVFLFWQLFPLMATAFTQNVSLQIFCVSR